jgi:hypothetical protein
MTPADAPPLTILGDGTSGWTLADYLQRNLGVGPIMESPERVPLPGTVLPTFSAGDPSSLDHNLQEFNELVHVFGALPAAAHLLGPHNPTPGAAPTAAHVGGIVAAICAGVSLASDDGSDVQQMAELCSIGGSAVSGAFGDPVAIAGAGVLFMRGMIELTQELYEMQLYLPCWPSCQNQPSLAGYAYH